MLPLADVSVRETGRETGIWFHNSDDDDDDVQLGQYKTEF